MNPRSHRDRVTDPPAAIGWIVTALSTGTALSALNSGMIAVALSTLRGEFAVDVPTVTWVITVFYLTSAVLQPLMGRLADRYGPLGVFTAGMGVVAIAGGIGPFAPTLEWVCVARVLLAVGTAAAFPSAAAILRRLAMSEGARLEAAPLIGRIQLIDTSAAAVGPILGGALIAVAGWEALFWINIPLAVLAIAATRLILPAALMSGARSGSPHPHEPPSMRRTLRASDLPGLVLFAATIVTGLMFLLDARNEPPWALLAAAVALGALFIWRERRAAAPFIDLHLLAANRALLRVYGLYILANMVLYGTLFGIPQYLEDHAGYSSAAVGILLVPLAAFNSVLARPIEKFIAARGHRPALLLGVSGLVLSSAALLVLTVTTAPWAVLLVMAALGIPYAFVLISLTQSLSLAAPAEHVGQAAGLFQTARSLGSIAGATIVGIALSHGTNPEDWMLLAAAVTGCAVLFAVVAAATGRTLR